MAIQPSTASMSTSNALAADARSLNALKLQSTNNSPTAIKEAAKQFESLFMRELLKSMRDATMKSGLMDSPGGDLGADLLDQQWAVQMSGRAGGLSDMIAAQLSRQTVSTDGTNASKAGASGSTGAKPRISPVSAYTGGSSTPTPSQSNFVQQHNAAANRVEQASGIPASYMLGQAGHETGWGKSEIRNADGSSSFNLFGIKAGSSWTGKVAEVTTTEYVDGVAKKTTAKFRAYDSYEDSFRDYARLINTSPRYAQAREQTGSAQAFASGLQKAGYATDPDYASKLSRAINTTQRLQRAQA
jgi:flagellar protein FlgJ